MEGLQRQRTAFLVIHGIGQQAPLETLDAFGRGLYEQLIQDHPGLELEHRVARLEDGGRDSSICIRPQAGEQSDAVDIHEYYWAALTEQRISPQEIWEWASETLAGTKRFYEENRTLLERYQKQGGVYSFKIQQLVRQLRWFYPLIRMIHLLPRWWWLQWLFHWVERRTTSLLVGYIGDLALYTNMDQKSAHFEIRRQVLNGAVSRIRWLLADDQIDRLIVVGHSLGSVIAYDALNRLGIEANLPGGQMLPLDKLGGLITFGSPLDKIAFFFRERTHPDQYIRRQVIDHLHSFKAKPLRFKDNKHTVNTVLTRRLEDLSWVNYYSDKDPISGHLDFYQLNEGDNIALELTTDWGAAHVEYWVHPSLYKDIAERFLA